MESAQLLAYRREDPFRSSRAQGKAGGAREYEECIRPAIPHRSVIRSTVLVWSLNGVEYSLKWVAFAEVELLHNRDTGLGPGRRPWFMSTQSFLE